MHSTGPSPRQLQEPVPDAGGLEPSAGAAAGSELAAPSGKPRKAWVDQPVTVGLVMALALPSLLDQVLSAIVGLTDTVVAGHTVNPGFVGNADDARAASAAAVGAMTYLQWFAGLMTSTLGVGATAIVSRSIGGKRPRLANRVAGTAISAAFVVGIAIAMLFYFGAHMLARAFSLHGDAEQYAVAYLHIMCWTVCLQTAGQIGMACLRGAGDTLRPMLVTVAVTIINGIASPALTFGWFGLPALGVRGNAIGTLLAFAVAGMVTYGFLVHGRAGLKLRMSHFKIVPHLLVRLSRIGVLSWLEGMILWGGQLTVVMLVMGAVDKAIGRAGSGMTMAAHNATLRIESLAFLPGFGFGIAASSLVGQYLGAGKPEQAQRSAVLSSRLALLTMTVAAVPMVLVPRLLLRWLVDSDEAVELGWLPLVIAGLAQPAFAIAIVKSQALKGAGDTWSPLWATVSGMGGRVVVVLSAMLYLSGIGHADWGLILVWVCIFLDLFYRGVVMEVMFRRGKWKRAQV